MSDMTRSLSVSLDSVFFDSVICFINNTFLAELTNAVQHQGVRRPAAELKKQAGRRHQHPHTHLLELSNRDLSTKTCAIAQIYPFGLRLPRRDFRDRVVDFVDFLLPPGAWFSDGVVGFAV